MEALPLCDVMELIDCHGGVSQPGGKGGLVPDCQGPTDGQADPAGP